MRERQKSTTGTIVQAHGPCLAWADSSHAECETSTEQKRASEAAELATATLQTEEPYIRWKDPEPYITWTSNCC